MEEKSISAKVVEALAREGAEDFLLRAAQDARILQNTASHACFTFVRLSQALLEFKEAYGEEAFKEALEVLGLDENIVLMTTVSVVRFCRMPTVVRKRVLRQVARTTIETLGVFDAGLREVGS